MLNTKIAVYLCSRWKLSERLLLYSSRVLWVSQRWLPPYTFLFSVCVALSSLPPLDDISTPKIHQKSRRYITFHGAPRKSFSWFRRHVLLSSETICAPSNRAQVLARLGTARLVWVVRMHTREGHDRPAYPEKELLDTSEHPRR